MSGAPRKQSDVTLPVADLNLSDSSHLSRILNYLLIVKAWIDHWYCCKEFICQIIRNIIRVTIYCCGKRLFAFSLASNFVVQVVIVV